MKKDFLDDKEQLWEYIQENGWGKLLDIPKDAPIEILRDKYMSIVNIKSDAKYES